MKRLSIRVSASVCLLGMVMRSSRNKKKPRQSMVTSLPTISRTKKTTKMSDNWTTHHHFVRKLPRSRYVFHPYGHACWRVFSWCSKKSDAPDPPRVFPVPGNVHLFFPIPCPIISRNNILGLPKLSTTLHSKFPRRTLSNTTVHQLLLLLFVRRINDFFSIEYIDTHTTFRTRVLHEK